MKHLRLFENFGPTQRSGRRYATCFQGDAYAAVGIIDEVQKEKLQSAIDRLAAEFPGTEDELKIFDVDVTGMGYVIHDENGEFEAVPNSTNTEDYAYYIAKDGRLGNENNGSDSFQVYEEARLFDLVEGKLLCIDHHGHTELMGVDEFIKTYIG
jgi:hypothetical protein